MVAPRIRYVKPVDGSRGHLTSQDVVVGFTAAVDPTTIPTNISLFDVTNQKVITEFTTEYVERTYEIKITYDWAASTIYQVQVHKDLQGAVGGYKFSREYQFSFETESYKILKPILLAPGNETRSPSIPTFKWTSPTGATLHELQVSGSSHFEYVDFNPTFSAVGGEELEATPDQLPFNAFYYWRVKGVNGPWSDIQTFYYGTTEIGVPDFKPFTIRHITPGDMMFLKTVPSVNILFNSTPTLTVEPRWVVTDQEGNMSTWNGTWAVNGNSLAFTPDDINLEPATRYQLYIDELYDVNNKPLETQTEFGKPIYALSGPVEPMLGSPYGLSWADPFTASIFLQMASLQTQEIVVGDTPYVLVQQHALLGAHIIFLEQQIGEWIPELGRTLQLGDYRRALDADVIDTYFKLLTGLKNRLVDIEDQIYGGKGIVSGRRFIDWDPETNTSDWYKEWRQGNMLSVRKDGLYQRTGLQWQ